MFKMYTIVQPEQSNIKDEVFMQCPGQSVYIHIYIYIYIYIYICGCRSVCTCVWNKHVISIGFVCKFFI